MESCRESRSVWEILGFKRKTASFRNCIPDLGVKGTHFARLALKYCIIVELETPYNCSLQTSHRTSFSPTFLSVERQGQGAPTGTCGLHISKGPFEGVHVNHTAEVGFLIGITALSQECLCKDCTGNGPFRVLSLKLCFYEQKWRSPIVSANFLLQIEAANTGQLAVSSSLKETCFSRILRISCPSLLEKHFLELLS